MRRYRPDTPAARLRDALNLPYAPTGAQARTIVEIGTGAGSSGLWLLDGMPADGVLTTIDISMEHQRAARAAYQRAGYPPQRTRIISGSALTVLPRLADAAYDLVLVDGEKDEYPAYVEQALRLVRRGGVIVLDNMLWHDRVADPAVRDETTKRLRALGKELRERDDLLTQIDVRAHPVDERHEDVQTVRQRAVVRAETLDDLSRLLRHDADRAHDDDDREDQQQDDDDESWGHVPSLWPGEPGVMRGRWRECSLSAARWLWGRRAESRPAGR